MNPMVWEKLPSDDFFSLVRRAKVPGGWLVYVCYGATAGVTFYPDPDHTWDGSSLP